jgi:hypothetical protein
MKTVLFVFAGLTLLIVLAIGGGVAWISNVKLDPKDPQFAQKFRATMETNCGNWIKVAMAQQHTTPDYQQEALIKQVCACSSREMMNMLARNKEMTPLQLEKAIVNNGPQIMAIKHSCAQAYGLPVPY